MSKTNDLKVDLSHLMGKNLSTILCELYNLDEAKVSQALQKQNNQSFISALLIGDKKLGADEMCRAISLQFGFDYIESIDEKLVPEECIKNLPIAFAKQHCVIPYQKNSTKELFLICCDPSQLSVIDEVKVLLRHDFNILLSTKEKILSAINKSYDKAAQKAQSAVEDLQDQYSDIKGDLEEEVVDLLDVEGDDEAPIIRLVNSLISQAVKDRASDVHLEPFEKEVVVRFRIDGLLYEIIRPPKRFQNSIISRVKILSGLNIAEKRLPQDGRIRLKVAGKDFDVRVSTIPTTYGERIVMRLLDRSSVLKTLNTLGFSKDNHKNMSEMIKMSHGIILVTGPTGSGKTSTLYACLSEINRPDLNILTIEDPVEYQLMGIAQVQVNPKINLSFASGLRSFLRQDPDVIMVGEIRDKETAEIAIQASLTGHLVLSTIHTNDSAGAVTRLLDMQIEPFLVTSSLIGILAQRLVRCICPHCKEEYKPSPAQLQQVGLAHQKVDKLYRGAGCGVCQQTGYLGRIGIFELLTMSDSIRDLVLSNADANAIKVAARKEGMKTLREDGASKILAGITTIEEVSRVSSEENIV